MSDAPPTTVWIGLRTDGVELARVQATCVEESRSNGVAKMKTLGPVKFSTLPVDTSAPLLTVSLSEHTQPFSAGELRSWYFVAAGDSVQLDSVTFEVVLDVPRYTPPPNAERKRWRTRLSD